MSTTLGNIEAFSDKNNVDTKFTAQTGSVSEIVDMSGAVFSNTQGVSKDDLANILSATSQTTTASIASGMSSFMNSSSMRLFGFATLGFVLIYAFNLFGKRKKR